MFDIAPTIDVIINVWCTHDAILGSSLSSFAFVELFFLSSLPLAPCLVSVYVFSVRFPATSWKDDSLISGRFLAFLYHFITTSPSVAVEKERRIRTNWNSNLVTQREETESNSRRCRTNKHQLNEAERRSCTRKELFCVCGSELDLLRFLLS